jgi:hypothetical protein
MMEDNLSPEVVSALVEKKFCFHEPPPGHFFELWLIAGGVLLAVAWLWPTIAACRQWLAERPAPAVTFRALRHKVRFTMHQRAARQASSRVRRAWRARPRASMAMASRFLSRVFLKMT